MAGGHSRREFLRRSAALSGVAAGAWVLPQSLRDVLASRRTGTGTIHDIDHVVILIQENRSFDHYFGTLSGVSGFASPVDGDAKGNGPLAQRTSSGTAASVLPFDPGSGPASAACLPDPPHDWWTQHAAWDHGAMDGWVTAHQANYANWPVAMNYFTRAEIPFHYALADAFTICDMYFCSVLGETAPNRLYALTGTIDPAGAAGGPIVSNDDWQSRDLHWTTYPERLQKERVSWKVYRPVGKTVINVLKSFPPYRAGGANLMSRGINGFTLSDFQSDVRHNTLPHVSWLYSPWSQCEHPPGSPSGGAQAIRHFLDILASNPRVWAKTAMFITYDEHGFFDHVLPPAPTPGTANEYLTGTLPASASGVSGPIGLGFRVPMIVISPWTRGGYVCSDVFDHTSLLRFLEVRFGIGEPNISEWRRQTCGDLTAAFRFSDSSRAFPTIPAPPTQSTNTSACTAASQVPGTQSIPRQEPGTRPHVP